MATKAGPMSLVCMTFAPFASKACPVPDFDHYDTLRVSWELRKFCLSGMVKLNEFVQLFNFACEPDSLLARK